LHSSGNEENLVGIRNHSTITRHTFASKIQEEPWTPEFPAFDNPGHDGSLLKTPAGTPGRLNQSHGKARFKRLI